jgi:hypothetical protein
VVYEVLAQSPDRIVLRTHDKARRGRGVLFATAPFVVYLLFCGALFILSANDLSLWERAKSTAAAGAAAAVALGLLAFLLGRRVHDVIDADRARIEVQHIPAAGAARRQAWRYDDVKAFAVDPSPRSLGADVLLVAVLRSGERRPLAEGDPHTGQIRDMAQKLAFLSGLPLEEPRHTALGQFVVPSSTG